MSQLPSHSGDFNQAHVFWPPPAPQIGRFVRYRLTADDVRAIHRQRLSAHVRATPVRADDVLAALVVRALGEDADAACNLQVFLDGPDTYWAQNIRRGDSAGTWAWPVRTGG